MLSDVFEPGRSWEGRQRVNNLSYYNDKFINDILISINDSQQLLKKSSLNLLKGECFDLITSSLSWYSR